MAALTPKGSIGDGLKPRSNFTSFSPSSVALQLLAVSLREKPWIYSTQRAYTRGENGLASRSQAFAGGAKALARIEKAWLREAKNGR